MVWDRSDLYGISINVQIHGACGKFLRCVYSQVVNTWARPLANAERAV